MPRITIVIADDHPVVRHGVRALLGTSPDFEVVGEAADGLHALELVRRHRPNVLVLDLVLPGLPGIEVARRVSASVRGTFVLAFSMHANDAYVAEALRAGATGYALKETSPADLLTGVREVAAGRRYLSPPLSSRVIDGYIAKLTGVADAFALLTPREVQVFELAATGLSTREVAAKLEISGRTVETHRAHIMRKLGLTGQADLVRYALRRGTISLL